jgi:hypothetical protein
MDEVGLPAEEGGRLQHVHELRHRRHLALGMHVGEHRHAERLLHLGEDLEALVHARAAKRLARAAVGLVIGRLEDERDAQLAGDVLQLARHVHLQLLAFHHAGPGDEEKRLVQPDFETAQVQIGSLSTALMSCCRRSP